MLDYVMVSWKEILTIKPQWQQGFERKSNPYPDKHMPKKSNPRKKERETSSEQRQRKYGRNGIKQNSRAKKVKGQHNNEEEGRQSEVVTKRQQQYMEVEINIIIIIH